MPLKGKRPPQYVMDLAHKAAADANRGKHRPEAVKKKISDAHKKIGISPATRDGYKLFRTGLKLPEEWKDNIGSGVKQFYNNNPKKREEKSDEMKNILENNPIIVENSRTRLENLWKRDRNTMVTKMRENRKKHLTLHVTEILNSMKNFEKDGFRCIPVDHTVANVQPDFIAFKDDKIFAVEVEVGRHAKPKPQKYKDITYFSDIIWIVKEG